MRTKDGRIVIGGCDVTDEVRRSVDTAPPLSQGQRDQLYLIFRDQRQSAGREER